jgi:hypothetical protein
MPVTYKKIASVTVTGATAANIEFTSIPATYTDLVIKVSSRGNASAMGKNLLIGFNGSTSDFTGRYVEGTGSAAASASVARFIGSTNAGTSTASTFGSAEIYIPNYAGSTNKSYSAEGLSENNASEAYRHLTAGLWSQTAAITSVTLTLSDSDVFVTNSTAVLYGIKKD